MPDKEEESTINIGLSSILEGHNAVAEAPPIEQAAVEQTPEENQPTAEIDPLVILAQQGEWAEIRNRVEPLLSGAGSADINRLWWLLSQLYLEEMPAAVLCAPFDEYLSALLAQDDFAGISGHQHLRLLEAAKLLSDRLESAGEHDLSIAILERVFRISRDHEIGIRLNRLVHQSLENLPRRVTFHTPSEMKKRLHLLDLRRELDADESKVFTITETAEKETQEVKINPHIVEGGGPRRAIFIFTAFIALCIGIWALRVQGMFDGDEGLQAAGSMSDGGVLAPSAEVPAASRISDVSHLAALAYDVAAKDDQQKNGQTENATIPRYDKTPSEPVEIKPSPKKEVLNTNGPEETDRIRSIVEGNTSTSRYDDDNRDASRNRDRLDLAREPAQALDRESSRGGSRDSDRPYTDRRDRPGRWEGGERYEVMINTSVFDRPSFHAREVAELYSGDRVLVDSRVGRWLKIRSVKGAPGYIMAQDAEKLFD